jgi:hypothetical protein
MICRYTVGSSGSEPVTDLEFLQIRDHLCAHVFAVYPAKIVKHITYIFAL